MKLKQCHQIFNVTPKCDELVKTKLVMLVPIEA